VGRKIFSSKKRVEEYCSGSQPFLLGAHFALKKFRDIWKIWKIWKITGKTLELNVAVTVFTVFLNVVTKKKHLNFGGTLGRSSRHTGLEPLLLRLFTN